MLIKILFFDYVKQNYIQIISFILVIAIIYPIQSVGLARVYGNLFDIIHKNTKLESIFDIKNVFKNNVPGLMILISLIYIFIGILYLSKHYLESLIIPSYFKYLRELFFNNFIKKYSNNFKDVKIGEILSKLFELNTAILSLFQNTCNYLLSTSFGLISISIYYFILDWKIGLIYLISVIMVIFLYYLNAHKQVNNSVKKFNILYKNNENLTDRLSNLMNIYINNEQNNEIIKFVKDENILKRQYIKNYWVEKTNITIADFIIIFSVIFLLFISYYGLKNKNLSTVAFISIIITLGSSTNYLFEINSELSNIIYYTGIIKSNETLLDEILTTKKRNIIDKNLNSGKIEFKNVSFSYEKNKYIFKNFNYTINDKEKVAIMGQSGSGKTTIMKLLIDLHEINEGKILVDNIDIKQIDTSYLRSKIVYINQRTTLFNRSILSNMLYGTNKDKQNAIDLLNKYDLMMVYNKLPNSINTNSGVNGNNLSLGMQKVTMIIRGVLKDGIIYAFDEPLTSLDGETRKKIIKLLMGELKNKTLIIITHDKEILPYMNKTLKMHELKN
jgi:ABC-type multidrug transport system fused ATPase/permease subunit